MLDPFVAEYKLEHLTYLKQSLEDSKPRLRDDDIAYQTNEIGDRLKELGKNEEALIYYEQALAIRRKMFVDDHHPYVAQSFDNIGAVLSRGFVIL